MDIKYVWYAFSTDKTGKRLGKRLHTNHGKEPPVVREDDVVLCWGNKIKNGYYPDCIYINHPMSIVRNRNKFRALKLLKRNGVSVPEYCGATYVIEKIRNKEISFPLIGRKDRHQEGKSLHLCLQVSDVDNAIRAGATHFTQYIPNKKEYRVHIFDGKVLRISEKVKKLDVKNVWIKSNKNGWKFRDLEDYEIQYLPEEITQQAVKAVKAMNLDFGAVDIILSDYDEIYVLEVNTGPSLNRRGRKLYVKEINNFINKIVR